MGVTVVNPLQFLRELFTVNGAGTLIRRGSRIDVRARVGGGRSGAAARAVRLGVRARRSATISSPARSRAPSSRRTTAAPPSSPRRAVAPYLTKFAVERQAQGEGLGGEIWSLVTRDYPAFFWRSRPENPITAWYVKQCDGLLRFPKWHVFWRGLSGRDDRAGRPPRAHRRQRLRLGLRADELTDLARDRAHRRRVAGVADRPLHAVGKGLDELGDADARIAKAAVSRILRRLGVDVVTADRAAGVLDLRPELAGLGVLAAA